MKRFIQGECRGHLNRPHQRISVQRQRGMAASDAVWLAQPSPAFDPLEHLTLIILFGGPENSHVAHTIQFNLISATGEGEFFVQRLPEHFFFRQRQ